MGYDVACLVPAGAPRGAVPGWLQALFCPILYVAPTTGFLGYLDIMATPGVVTKTEEPPCMALDLFRCVLARPPCVHIPSCSRNAVYYSGCIFMSKSNRLFTLGYTTMVLRLL